MTEAWIDQEIILYGESICCHDFYVKYHEFLQITTIVCTDGKENGRQYLHSLPVTICDNNAYRFKISSSSMIIVCAGDGRKEEHDEFLYGKGFTYELNYLDSWYIEIYFSRKIKQNIEKKTIWIFGAGNNGKLFYEQNKNKYNISGFISNFEKEKECKGLPVIRPSEITRQEDIFIVICSDAGNEMVEQLRRIGMRNMEDFCMQSLITKKLFIAWGACQVYSIVNMLYANPSFQEEYFSISVFDSRFQECSHADRQRLHTYGDVCDVLFYNSEGMMERNRAFVEQYYQGAEVYNIPFYSFQGQLMQATGDCSEYSLRYEALKRHYAYWFIGDYEIEKMIKEGLSTEEILDAVSSDDYWTVEEINRNWQSEIKKIQVLDRLSSVKLSGFVTAHYKEQMIFKDGIHFSKELCIFLANQLAQHLKLPEISEKQQAEILKNCPEEEINCLPVYPCVKKALEMSGTGETYKFLHGNGKYEILSFREYESRYIDYVRAVISISTYCGTRVI